MLNLERYAYYTNDSYMDYEFESIGPKGIIKKVARFAKMGQNIYNFGFGDLNQDTGEIHDTVVSNNEDGDKVLATLAGIIYDFTSIYTDAAIYIKGTNPARTRRYQMGINKYWDQINPVFEIFGEKNEKWQSFRKDENYNSFLGRRKVSLLLRLNF